MAQVLVNKQGNTYKNELLKTMQQQNQPTRKFNPLE